MSRIAAVLGPATESELYGHAQTMARAMAHTAVTTRLWTGSGVGLALLSRPSLSTGAGGGVNVATVANGTLAVVADARIDNRQELAPRLQLSVDCTDAALLLAAYQRWGTWCPQHLVGDFAFVLWDGVERQLLCARDPVGARPLAYLDGPRPFACASELGALLSLPQTPRRLDERYVAQHLLGRFEEPERSIYCQLRRLPPGHTLRVSDGRIQRQRYWEPSTTHTLHLRRDEDYAEALHDELGRAVGARLPRDGPPGAMLSGGLDSSSVVCLARRRLPEAHDRVLQTFCAVFSGLPADERRRADERPYMEAVIRGGRVQAHFLEADLLLPLPAAALDGPLAIEPFFSPNFYIHWAAYQRAGSLGIQGVLDGLGGDEVVSNGDQLLVSLLRRGRWLELKRRTEQLADNFGAGSPTRIWRYLLRQQLPSGLVRSWDRLRGRPCTSAVIRPAFAVRQGFALHPPRAHPSNDPREIHRCQLRSALIPRALELANRAGALHGLEPSFPFLDRRVIELCLAMPPEQHLHGGWHRSLLRRAMQDTLPPAVQWRSGKGNLAPNFYRQLFCRQRHLLEQVVLRSPETIADYVDVACLQRQYRRCLVTPTADLGGAQLQVYAAVTLGLWLRRTNLA